MGLKKAPKKPKHKRSAMRFYWWRRFGTHKNLPKKTSLLKKIQNGDFLSSPYWDQARWEDTYSDQHIKEVKKERPLISQEEILDIERTYIKRKNRLLEDAFNDDTRRLKHLEECFVKELGGSKKLLYKCIENCEGDEEVLYHEYREQVKSL